MPIYEFECRKCKAHLEVFQKLNDKPPVKCRKCGGRLEKMVSASSIQFKGTGWYVTDYGGKSVKDAKSEEKREAASAAGSDKPDKSEKSKSDKSDKSEKKDTSPSKKTSDKASSTKTSSGD